MSTAVFETRDKNLIAEFCRRDPALYAYYLGDLDDFFFDRTRWWAAADTITDSVSAVALWYESATLLVIQGLGKGDAQEKIWREVLPKAKVEVHVHYNREHENILSEYYNVNPSGTFYKMRLEYPPDDKALELLGKNAEIATSDDLTQITALQNRAYPESYIDHRLLETGKCAIARDEDSAIAFAACHVCSSEHSVASLGAITTDPEFRRRGFATAVTAKILQLLKGQINDICLNVHSDNSAAIGVYKKLGFEIHTEYEEAVLTAK
jgi:ribosomal protein S18 acetylase RimI-like enzyme